MSAGSSSRLAVFVLMLVCLASGCGAPRTATKPQGPSMRVMTYNLNYSGHRADLNVGAIGAGRADVVFLQETTPPWERYLAKQFGGAYPHRRFLHGPGAGGQGVLSRWPILSERVLEADVDGSWFPAWLVVVETPLGPVQFLGVHLRPAMGATGFTVSAYLSTDTVRANEIAVHAARLAADQPAIVLGDFNEDGEPIAWLTRRGFTNALPEYDVSTPTWRWPTRLVELDGRYDHLCYSRHLDCCAARVIDAGASDHFPVVGDFTLKPASSVPVAGPAR